MKITSHRFVEYRGAQVMVPHHATHIAMDRYKGLHWFEGKPHEGGWSWLPSGSSGYICNVETDADWTETLEEIK